MSWLDNAQDHLAAEKERQEKKAESNTWKPKPGDTLVGTVIDVTMGTYDGKNHPIITVEDLEGGVHSVWCSSKVLRDAAYDWKPGIGKGISIFFEGKRQPKRAGGREYNFYVLTAEELDTDLWDNLRAAPSEQGSAQQVQVVYPAGDLEAPF